MISTALQGRLGNQFYQIAFLLQYAKKHNLEYHVPSHAAHCDGTKIYFPQMITNNAPGRLRDVLELPVHATANGDGTYRYHVPEYREWEQMDNVRFVGYWQTFKYIDWCRDYILEKFAIPYKKKGGCVSIHVRRGDFLQLQDKHPKIDREYYLAAVKYFQDRGYNKFDVYSDDILWCATEFTTDVYNGAQFCFSVNPTEYDDFISMSHCEHNICCYSTFSFIAAWLNQNPDKIVLIPERKYCFSGAHTDFIPEYYTELPC